MMKMSFLSLCALMSFALVSKAAAQPSSRVPTASGQAAFGAISEVVQILDADPATDWAKVNLEALRQHLIDMDAVMMRSSVKQRNVAGGIEAEVTSTGVALASLQRIAENHNQMLNMMPDYRVSLVQLSSGVRLTILARDAANVKTVARIRGLGFAGMLTEGDHHAAHHLAIARGETVHMHND